MKQLLIISILLLMLFQPAKAQQNQRIYYGLKGGVSTAGNVFKRQYTSNLYIGPLVGIYADFCLYKRLWLFAGIDFGYGYSVVKNRNYISSSPVDYNGYPCLFGSLAIAYRITNEDKGWQMYPYIGSSNILYRGFYKFPMVGFEAKHEYGKRGSISTGINLTTWAAFFGTPQTKYMLGYANVYVKIGFGALKRKVD